MSSAGMACKERALELAGKGIYTTPLIFPPLSDKDPLPDKKKPRNPLPLIKWSKAATLDPDKINQMPWHRAQGVAIITGLSGVAVVDVDTHTPERNGMESLKQFEAEHGPLPETYTEETPGGGLHYIYRLPEGMPPLDFSGEILPGLEVKSGKCLVTIAPSRRHGKPYVATNKRDFAPLPASVEEAVNKVKEAKEAAKKAQATRKPARKSAGTAQPFTNGRRQRYGQSALEGECKKVREAQEGERNKVLNTAALKVFRNVANGSIAEEDAISALTEEALACGLSQEEIRRTLESAKQKGLTDPREPEERPFTVNKGQYQEEPGTQEEDAAYKLPFGFCYDRDGNLLHVEYNEKGEVKKTTEICKHVEVIGKSEGAAKSGYVLRWTGRCGETKEFSIPARLFVRPNTDLTELLAEEGLIIEADKQRLFKKFVIGFEKMDDALPIIRNVNRVGWYEGSFVLPDTTIGAAPDTRKVILQAPDNELSGLYQTGGTLEGWQEMAALCAGNTRLVFGLSLPMSGPLLYFVPKVSGTIFNFCGPSTTGKTTALDVAASAWGYPEKQKRTWRLTDNGLESICALYNDSVLYLDEMGEVEADALQGIAYMFAGGTGKTRARRDGGAKNLQSWRSVALSTGEVSLKTKLLEAGLKAYAGQQVRFVDIPITGAHMSSWHGLPSAKALAEELSRRTMLDFGLAGRAFLARLVQDLETVRNNLSGMVSQVERVLCPVEADAQVLRVAQRFALVCVGGQLAQGYGILPQNLEIFEAVQSCFNDWLAARGSLGSAEEQNILRTIRRFIEQHGNSRFQDENCPQRPCINRVGFVRENDAGKREYFFFRESFAAEVAKGFELSQVIRVLDAAGWLKRDKDRHTRRAQFENDYQAFYCVRLPEDGGGNE